MFDVYEFLKAGILGSYDKAKLDQYLSFGMLTQDEYNELVEPFVQQEPQSSTTQPASSAPASSASQAPQSFYQPNQSSSATK